MTLKWVQLEEDCQIKEQFRGYKEGLVSYNDGKTDWVVQPPTARMLAKYKVSQWKFGILEVLMIFNIFRI